MTHTGHPDGDLRVCEIVKMAVQIVLDSAVRNWAFLPIILATLLVGLIRVYGSQGGAQMNPFAQPTNKDSLKQAQVGPAQGPRAGGATFHGLDTCLCTLDLLFC